MKIDKSKLDSLGDRWMVRTDNDGCGYGGFMWSPVGEWTECPKWSDQTAGDCGSGGLFGQGPGGFGLAQPGSRFVFCETGAERFVIDNDKIKVRRARILYTGADAMQALIHVTKGVFQGSLDLRGTTLPAGLVLPQRVGGSIDLRDTTLPADLVLPQKVGGSIYLSDTTLPDGLVLPQKVGGSLYLIGTTLPADLVLPQRVGGSIDLRDTTLPADLVLPQKVGGSIYLSDTTLPDGLVLPQKVGGSLYLSGARMPGCRGVSQIRAKLAENTARAAQKNGGGEHVTT